VLDAVATSTPHIVAPHGVTAWDWIHAGIIVVATFVLAQILRRLTARAVRAAAERPLVRLLERFVAYVIFLAGFVYALEALHVQIGPLVGALGIGGVALAFALQDILQNLVAGIIIQARRPIRVGDQVDVGSQCQGTVKDIDLRTVLIRTFDGLDIYVPNKTVLENAITNYTITPNRRLKLDVGVAYGTDLAEAKTCLIEAARSVEGVLSTPEPAAWVVEFADSCISFSVLFWFEVGRSFWEVRSDVAIAIDRNLREAGIHLPFPQRTLSLDAATTRLLAPTEPTAGDGQRSDRERSATR
jgi:small conductance mechanosensitive channel